MSRFVKGAFARAQKSVFAVFLTCLAGMGVSAPSSFAEIQNKVLKGDPNKVPYMLENVGVEEHLGSKIDIENLTFTNSADLQQHKLKEYFQNGKPTLLNLVYYECPMLCTMVLNGVVTGMKDLDWSVGKEFNVITVSINPKEPKGIAEEKRAAYINSYGRNTAQNGWHFFTGEESQISALANQLGFSYKYDKESNEYGHPAVTFILTPDGKISRYLYGITYRARDLRLALLEASQGKIGNVFDRLLMFCYHYEPSSRGYSLHAVKVMQAGGAGTVALLAGYLTVFWTRQRKKKGQQNT